MSREMFPRGANSVCVTVGQLAGGLVVVLQVKVQVKMLLLLVLARVQVGRWLVLEVLLVAIGELLLVGLRLTVEAWTCVGWLALGPRVALASGCGFERLLLVEGQREGLLGQPLALKAVGQQLANLSLRTLLELERH